MHLGWPVRVESGAVRLCILSGKVCDCCQSVQQTIHFLNEPILEGQTPTQSQTHTHTKTHTHIHTYTQSLTDTDQGVDFRVHKHAKHLEIEAHLKLKRHIGNEVRWTLAACLPSCLLIDGVFLGP